MNTKGIKYENNKKLNIRMKEQTDDRVIRIIFGAKFRWC
jgi:hypothetical protein